MGEYAVILTEEEEKALLWNMVDIQEWLDNAIHNKARQCIDSVCHQALTTGEALTAEEKREIVTVLSASGEIITSVKKLPEFIKAQIVSKARIKSAAERNAEEEAELRKA